MRTAPGAVTTVVMHVPAACGRCQHPLPAAAGPTDPADAGHQVTDLPEVVATVTEHRRAARQCPACGHLTRAVLPAGVPPGAFGPRLQATIALLTGRYRLSKREAADGMATLFGASVAVGSVSGIEQAVSAALAPVVAEVEAAVQRAPVVHLDETGWRQGRRRAWLWTAVTQTLTLFRIDRHRSRAVVEGLLGPEWQGVVISDRYSAYKRVALDHRQVCWAHARRDFQKLAEYDPAARPVGERLLAITAQVFELWERYAAGEIDRVALLPLISRVAAEMQAVLLDGQERGHPVVQTLSREYLAVWPALWTFVVVAGVEPTNNPAERALRPAVLWRKGSFGTHSADGSRFVERMLTVVATCRQQHRDSFAVLRDALTAAHPGRSHPSLVPLA